MQYEPVGYIIEYEISALAFLVVIMLRYFAAQRFPNQKNRLFALILWISLVDLVLDVVSSVIIDNVFLVPLPATYIVNAAFYFLQILLPILMTAYTLVMVGQLTMETIKRSILMLIPGLTMLILLLANVFTHDFFYVDPQMGYVHGKWFIYTYLVCLFYMAVTFVVTFRNMKHLRRLEYMTIYRFLVIVTVAMAIQFVYPALLLSGVAIALAVIMMYFTIQNPDAMQDATTGAFTADAMMTFLHDRRQARECVRMVSIKINNMSRINDLLGIENGSQLLRELSRFLRESAGEPWVFRMRGGCFVAMCRTRENYLALSRNVEQRIGLPWTVGDTDILLRATVCYLPTDEFMDRPISPEDAVNYLDFVFQQNEHSPNRIRTVTVGEEFVRKMNRRRAVEKALREAIACGEGLEPYFQPLWSVKEERFTNAEVLLRFNHPTMGFIAPDEFVPIAESCGLVTAMDELVTRKVCGFVHGNSRCRELGLKQLEINLSALEFMHRRLPDMMNDIMAQYEVDPSFLCFEITETAATESFELLKECMGELSAVGCKFALDDFGTGFANISQVLRLPFSVVKLDRSLLLESELVLEHMAHMFADMNYRTVIEGVETAEQAERMKKLNVDYIQGYYYARPMDQQDFMCFLEEKAKDGKAGKY